GAARPRSERLVVRRQAVPERHRRLASLVARLLALPPLERLPVGFRRPRSGGCTGDRRGGLGLVPLPGRALELHGPLAGSTTGGDPGRIRPTPRRDVPLRSGWERRRGGC